MKNLILGLGLILGSTSFASTTNEGIKPAKNLHGWLTKNAAYPIKAIENKEEGTVYVAFTISESGNVENVELAQGVSLSLNEAALNVVKQMPANELLSGSEKYDTVYIVPIKFVIK